MILYFANRIMEIMGSASTNLHNSYVIVEDLKTEDVETGVATFDCKIGYKKTTRKTLEEMTKVGNYVLRKHGGENEFYTIIDREIDTKNQEIYVYAEDAGLDLLNEIAEAYEATEAHTAEWYFERWILDSGFEIGINEIPKTSTRKLKWEGESTVTERLASIATQFGGYEISFSFDIKGMEITNKYVNIHSERGKNIGETLRLNKDIDRIITKESIANLATALKCTGGTPENSETPITLKGYSYDDGDFYIGTDGILRSRNACAKWSRYVWNKEPNVINGYAGNIIRTFSYDTLEQSTLCSYAIAELKKVCEPEINYEIDISKLPEYAKIGDRVNIVDDAGELYISSRILSLETSATEGKQTAIIGEHLIRSDGISSQVVELATKFAETAAARVQALAEAAKKAAENATNTANNAQNAVENVEKDVENLETTVSNAQQAAENATAAASESQVKANEAMQAAANAIADAAAANAAVEIAQSAASSALSKAETAQNEANTAKSEAETAQATAEAAKKDAQKASEEIATLGENLDTVSQTMQADYARKTELTEAKASLQTQITQNAAEISATASKVTEIDETANNAAEQAAQAKAKADEAKTNAQTAQSTADTAKANAATAQSKADAAAQAAQVAQTAADEADAKAAAAATDLATAKSNLAAVTSRVGATEAEIAEAEAAVAAAQKAADEAAEDAAAAQSTANTAKANAATAQTAANNAKTAADNAQKAADDAQDAADAAQAAVDSLAVRVTTAETKITQNSEQIALRATKTEVTTTLGGYYNKTQTEALIKVEADKITSQASKIDGLTTRMSTVEQTADGLTVELESLTVGGRNLIAGTSKTTEHSGNKGSASYKDVWTGKTIDIPTGTEYIVSFEAKAAVAQTIQCFFFSPNTTTKAESSTGQTSTSADGSCNVSITTDWKRYWVKWTQTAATAVKNVIVGRNTTANNIYIRAVKLEEGNRATSWTPAPEDVSGSINTAQTTANSAAAAATAAQSTADTANSTANTAKANAATAQSTANTARTEAANAAKTATNYLNFSNSGLVIGDMTATTLGRNVLIDSDSVDIRNGSTVLASFGADTIELGKNASSSQVYFCGGNGKIYYGNDTILGDSNHLILSAGSAALQSTSQCVLYTAAGSYDWSMVKTLPNSVHLEAYYNVAQSGGTGVYSGTTLDLYQNELYGLSDSVQFVGRYGMTLQTVSGDIEIPAGHLVPTERIYANGGLRLANGGQITGNSNAGTEITMLQMNADNYVMLGYGSYVNSIGATYVDGNVVNIRSKGNINFTGNAYFSKNLEVTSGTLQTPSLELYHATPYIDFHYGKTTADFTARIIADADQQININAPSSVKLSVSGDFVSLNTSTNSTYSAFFRPNTNGKCTLGDSSHRWYAVYASNGTIQTSDRREKENIIPIGISQLMPSDDGGPDKVVDLHSELFDRLQPVQYNFIEGNKKICYGLIAQDVIEAMHEVGIGENELDLVHHDFWTDEKGDESETYGLGYTNLIALLIHEVQKLKTEVKMLKGA